LGQHPRNEKAADLRRLREETLVRVRRRLDAVLGRAASTLFFFSKSKVGPKRPPVQAPAMPQGYPLPSPAVFTTIKTCSPISSLHSAPAPATAQETCRQEPTIHQRRQAASPATAAATCNPHSNTPKRSLVGHTTTTLRLERPHFRLPQPSGNNSCSGIVPPPATASATPQGVALSPAVAIPLVPIIDENRPSPTHSPLSSTKTLPAPPVRSPAHHWRTDDPANPVLLATSPSPSESSPMCSRISPSVLPPYHLVLSAAQQARLTRY